MSTGIGNISDKDCQYSNVKIPPPGNGMLKTLLVREIGGSGAAERESFGKLDSDRSNERSDFLFPVSLEVLRCAMGIAGCCVKGGFCDGCAEGFGGFGILSVAY
jgi:hypothetical protein